MKSSTGSRIGSAVFWSVLAKSARFVLGLAGSVIVVRGLGKNDYGILSLIRTFLMFAVLIAGVGLGQALLKFLPHLRVRGSAGGARKLVLEAVLLQTTAWVLLLAACHLLQPFITRIFIIEGIGRLFFLAMGFASIELYYALLTNIFNAGYDTKLMSIANVISHMIYIGLLFIFIPKWGVLGVVAAGAAGNLFAGIVLAARVGRHLKTGSESDQTTGIGQKRLMKYSLPFAIIGVLNLIVWRQSETIFLAHFHGPVLTGFFDLAYRIPQNLLEFVPLTVWPLIMAGFSETYARDKKNIIGAIEKYYKVLFMLCAPICFFGASMGGRLIYFLFGPEMAPAAIPAQIFFIVFTMSFFATPLSMTLYVIEKSFVNMMIYLVFTVINVGLDLILIPAYGLAGAVAPVCLVIFISPFVYYKVLSVYIKDIRIPFVFIGKCFLASSPFLLAFPFLTFMDTAVEFTIAVFLLSVLTLAGFRLLQILGKEEIEILNSLPFPMMGKIVRLLDAR